ncbi:MAG: tetratricopeptide repeat protein [Candidatus Methylomirabilia bacterium]
MDEETAREQAEHYFHKGYEAQTGGELEEAIAYYKKSIECFPTAEAHTFLGWTHSFRGDYEAAIRECHLAIEVDPDFGNPYNDIGAYLIELGRYDEAIPWLKKAMLAKRYEPRHYPHANLSRVYIKQGKFREAIGELERALELEPRYTHARRELHRLVGMLN